MNIDASKLISRLWRFICAVSSPSDITHPSLLMSNLMWSYLLPCVCALSHLPPTLQPESAEASPIQGQTTVKATWLLIISQQVALAAGGGHNVRQLWRNGLLWNKGIHERGKGGGGDCQHVRYSLAITGWIKGCHGTTSPCNWGIYNPSVLCHAWPIEVRRMLSKRDMKCLSWNRYNA